jgi:hypothetical protein
MPSYVSCTIKLTDTSAAIDEVDTQPWNKVGVNNTLINLRKMQAAARVAGATPNIWYYLEAEITDEGVVVIHHLELEEERQKRLAEEDARIPYPREWREMPHWGLHYRTLRKSDDLTSPRVGYGHTESGFYPLERVLEREREEAAREGREPDEAFIRSLFDREPHIEFKNGTDLRSLEALVGTVAVNEETREKLVSYVCHDLTSTVLFSEGFEPGSLDSYKG